MAVRVGRGQPGSGAAGRTAEPIVEGCIFCRPDDESLNRVMLRNATCFARYDNFPAADGHVEIVPIRHVESLFELSKTEVADAYALLCEAERRLSQEHQPHGYTIGVNEGTAAGQSIAHLHIHLIPRYRGDVPDPRGGIRQAVPNWDPDSWLTDGAES